ncbi:hypothetical protein CCUS01_04679 [Colletotrichum cuscutae]|uniref:Uncharacterized protein n=1 Tax=Colletotrichum cuscutae TaxID=1209917 RepID=A0AAI9VA28_9PEZI|nr:hypothetical protein CCUS01_04679 [Colletotrichum cuscutae]
MSTRVQLSKKPSSIGNPRRMLIHPWDDASNFDTKCIHAKETLLRISSWLFEMNYSLRGIVPLAQSHSRSPGGSYSPADESRSLSSFPTISSTSHSTWHCHGTTIDPTFTANDKLGPECFGLEHNASLPSRGPAPDVCATINHRHYPRLAVWNDSVALIASSHHPHRSVFLAAMFWLLVHFDFSLVAKIHLPANLLFVYQPDRIGSSPVCDTHAQTPAAFSTTCFSTLRACIPAFTGRTTARSGWVETCRCPTGGVEGKDARRSSLTDRRIPHHAAPPTLLKITKTLCHHARRLRILYQAAIELVAPIILRAESSSSLDR